MDAGKAWVITELHHHTGHKSLVSMLNPRRSQEFVRRYLEQANVDRYASIQEKIDYKKHPSSSPFEAVPINRRYLYVFVCGHDPIMHASYCHRLTIASGILTYAFKTLHDVDNQLHPTFKEVCRTVVLD